MKWGEQYFWEAKTSLGHTLKVAVAHFKGKHGVTPDRCEMRGAEIPAGVEELEGLALVSTTKLPPRHFWIGQEKGTYVPAQFSEQAAPASGGDGEVANAGNSGESAAGAGVQAVPRTNPKLAEALRELAQRL